MTLGKLRKIYWLFNFLVIVFLFLAVYEFFVIERGFSTVNILFAFFFAYLSVLFCYFSRLVDEGTTDDRDSNLFLFFLTIDIKGYLMTIQGWYPGVFSRVAEKKLITTEGGE